MKNITPETVGSETDRASLHRKLDRILDSEDASAIDAIVSDLNALVEGVALLEGIALETPER